MAKRSVVLIVMLIALLTAVTVPYVLYSKEPSASTVLPKKRDNTVPCDLSKPFFKLNHPIVLLDNYRYVIPSCAADVNGDGKLDLIVAKQKDYPGECDISILYNHGKGIFEERRVFIAGEMNISSINADDYDGDGDIDILVARSEAMWYHGGRYWVNSTIYLLRNVNNSFEPERIVKFFGIPGGGPQNWIHLRLTSADFDNDGDVDFLATGNCGKVLFFRNDGTGNFTYSIIWDYGDLIWGITSADFNNDGWIDYIVARGENIFLKLNDKSELCFNHSAGKKIGSTCVFCDFVIGIFAPSWVSSLDYNNDGWMDFILNTWYILSLWMNFNGSFKPFYLGCFPYGIDEPITCGDFDGDTYPDIVLNYAGKLCIYLNNKTFVAITKPHQPINVGVFYKGKLVLVNFGTAIIIGNVTIGAEGLEPLSRVEFYLDGELVKVDDTPPYEWEWKTRYFIPRKHTIDAVAYRSNGEYGGKYSVKVWKIL